MTKKRSKSCTYHLRSSSSSSSSKATKRQNSKPHSASSVCRSNSSDKKKDTSSQSHCINAGQETSLATSSRHSHDARKEVVETVDSSAAAHLASTLTHTLGKKTVSLHRKSSNNEQRQMERSTSSNGKDGGSSRKYTTVCLPSPNDRKQRAHSVIPVLPVHSSIAQAHVLRGSKNNQREDVLNAFCTSALWSSVDHPNCGRLNQMKKQQQQQQQHYNKLEYSFCPPIQSNSSLSDNHLSTITISSQPSDDKMTYPPPPPPEIDPAATSASYGAYPTSGNLSSGAKKKV
ncbi:uncharacterized protein FA14DRAFT_157795 [Meira miltonrushii]|uniref:Uncharacterized protein n=1 Tax=Meira miltonrushii TaxID=1280837 RepID=A0A316V6R3_9BASI|nr:uncharacterized protein FA14DRAFT_157795 [Meira miltonrushii]PWN33112.1 hypothetical protein FA14DRAFT_157795 [Meira miltonrushii]